MTRITSISDLELAPGTVLFDQWRVERVLGRGGSGIVIEAEELTLCALPSRHRPAGPRSSVG